MRREQVGAGGDPGQVLSQHERQSKKESHVFQPAAVPVHEQLQRVFTNRPGGSSPRRPRSHLATRPQPLGTGTSRTG